jgi:hypothetical protein
MTDSHFRKNIIQYYVMLKSYMSNENYTLTQYGMILSFSFLTSNITKEHIDNDD